jgi:hypothetical protein
LLVGQRNGDGAGDAVGVGDGEIGVLGAAILVPHLSGDGPAGQVDGSISAVFELQRDAVSPPGVAG